MSFIDECNHSSFQNGLAFDLTMSSYHSIEQNVEVVDQKTCIFVKKMPYFVKNDISHSFS